MKTRETKDCQLQVCFEEAEEDGEQVMQRADAKNFEEEHKSDESLKAWWKLAEDKHPEFCVVNGLLCKRHRILDQVICQVVLPKDQNNNKNGTPENIGMAGCNIWMRRLDNEERRREETRSV